MSNGYNAQTDLEPAIYCAEKWIMHVRTLYPSGQADVIQNNKYKSHFIKMKNQVGMVMQKVQKQE